uniref:Secreted protein n=1 Tax=Chromera velia CCMP2878 TaxID=1169474 RepID=A0A0G4GRU6_9ALVE|eukprot:Cvel_23118.t1-p1 / transcript=Cvel_23118.t1 / gene=Cvel_23118 / organism=Chromera_velia_CCMP2878 / gene_product=hypothetical protein / transcript_product=hypothetical protein / location=Cvel_scaffold2348:6347-8238(+) / protein_length=94 / sequence_SO=supercontig / SO=protein_coding / is_pseudo=false
MKSRRWSFFFFFAHSAFIVTTTTTTRTYTVTSCVATATSTATFIGRVPPKRVGTDEEDLESCRELRPPSLEGWCKRRLPKGSGPMKKIWSLVGS